jgi:hypothetical protein
MQIYGDSSCDVAVGALANALLARIGRGHDLESLRAILIGCGQLEQLISDADGTARESRDLVCRATDHAARAFYALWSRVNCRAPRSQSQVSSEIEALRLRLRLLARLEEVIGTLKIPEGFAFYALYPEQYCAAAVAYLQQRGRTQGTTHVIGLRSIGTTLSASLAAVLNAADVEHRRYTVRPHGHPFERQVELPWPFAVEDTALVVDEGPGLSGSSFYSVSRALDMAGVASQRQVYFCAHPHPPGKMASTEISSFWAHAERYVASNHDCAISPEGSLRSTLEAELTRSFHSRVRSFEDVSQGRWRGAAFGQAPWPCAYPAFERPKLLAQLADGRRALMKFYGQVLRSDPISGALQWSDAAAARQIAEGAANVAQIQGYVARPWLDGELLTRAEKSPSLLAELARLLAGRPWRRARETSAAAECYYGATGGLAPQEWLRLADGQLRKLPETLPGYDHTAIDAEPLGWDLAAAVVEWQLTNREAEQLLALFRARSGIGVELREVQPHIRRYARFNTAKAQFCAHQASGTDTQRLEIEAARYAAYEPRAP